MSLNKRKSLSNALTCNSAHDYKLQTSTMHWRDVIAL